METKKIILFCVVIFLLPAFVFVNITDINGNRVNLRTKVEKSIVLLNFFSVDCLNCTKEFPELKEIVASLSKNNRNFKFILISEDNADVSSDTITKFIKPFFPDIKLDIYRDVYHQQYQLNSKNKRVAIPRNIILENGKVILDLVGYTEENIKKIKKILEKNIFNQCIPKMKRFTFVMKISEDPENKLNNFVKAFCASKNIMLIKNPSESILMIEEKAIGGYKLYKASIADSDGNVISSKSVMVYHETETLDKIKNLLNTILGSK